MKVIPIKEEDYPTIAEIYKQGIATGNATFETRVPDWHNWDTSHLDVCRIALTEDDKILGWAALSPVSSRSVYAGVAELSVYVERSAHGRGIGKILLTHLIKQSESHNIWTLQSGIFSSNKASIALHKKCGFRIIGYRERIGKLNGKWIDNTLMERRSKVVGMKL